MPIRISDSPDSPGTMAISLEQFEQGRQNFKDHYSLYQAADPEQFGGQDFKILWSDLQTAVDDFASLYSIPLEEVALRFVHCYDPAPENALYLRVQLCRLGTTGITSYEKDVFALHTSDSAWYQLKEMSMMHTGNQETTDATYMNNFVYNETQGSTPVLLADGMSTFVQALVFPWENEILAMYNQNGQPDDAKIHFASTSYVDSNYQGMSAVTWPHGMVMYLENEEGPMLNNDTTALVMFSYKGCDMATTCPPQCNSYVEPLNPDMEQLKS